MGKRQQEELRRLEEALLESDTPQTFGNNSPQNNVCAIYNADETDVDLDAYSEEVHQGRSGNGLSIVLTMVTMVALSAGILLLLKLLGVL